MKTLRFIISLSLLQRIGKLLRFEQVPVRWPSVDRDATASAEDVEEQFDLLVEANDHLLEQVVS